MALWNRKGNREETFEAVMYTGDNLGFINDRFGSSFYIGDHDTLWLSDSLGCRPGCYVAKQNDEYRVYHQEVFADMYEPYVVMG